MLTAPPSPTATPISTSQINLAWTAVLNASFYRVYRNGVLVASPTGTTSSSTGLTPSTLYTFRVSTVGADGQEGPQGSAFTATTLALPDTTAPTVPGSVAATALSTTTIRITWAGSTDSGGSGLAGYRVFRSTTLTGTYAQLGPDLSAATLTLDDTSLSASTTRFYKVLAFDGNNNASALSAAASATTQPDVVTETFDFYISPTGSDSNNGLTTGTPWAITALATKGSQIARKRVGLLDGTYRLSGSDDTAMIYMTAAASGDSATHTVIKSVNPRQAVITTNNGSGGYPQGSGGIGAIDTIQINASYIDFVNIKMGPTGGHGFTVLDAHDVLFEGCHLFDMYAKRKTSYNDDNMGAIFFRQKAIPKSNITVRNCLIEDIYARTQTVGSNDSNGVGDLFGVSNLLVEYCTFRRMGSVMFWKDLTTNVTFRYNRVEECSGFTYAWCTANTALRPSTNEVYGNLAKVNWGFGPGSANLQGDVSNVANFYNNTVILDLVAGANVCDFGFLNLMGGASSQALKFYNNAIYLNPSFALFNGMIVFPAASQTLNSRISVWDYNRYSKFNIEDYKSGVSYSTLGAWQATGRDVNSPAVGSLGLVNQSGTTVDEFRPAAGSALLSAGRVGGTGSTPCDIGWTGVTSTVGHDW